MQISDKKKAIIIGAGPAGLTAAYEFATKTDIVPIIIEKDGVVGGIAKTIDFKGNKSDIGPHRFFSKVDYVENLWKTILPFETEGNKKEEKIMLLRDRKTRIYFLKKLFDYPISLNAGTLMNLGLVRVVRIFFSYLKVAFWPIRDEKNLEDFYINRFGRELYETFFKSYTKKVWGRECSLINKDWGAQRVKGLSIRKAIADFFVKKFLPKKRDKSRQETSLVENFHYPKHGSSQIWDSMAETIKSKGGEIRFNSDVIFLNNKDGHVESVKIKNNTTGESEEIAGDYFLSSMPIKDLVGRMDGIDKEAKEVGANLEYRDMVLAILLYDKINLREKNGGTIKDNWLYLQDAEMVTGRMQICNNMSPFLLKDQEKILISLEYLCNEGDDFWNKSEEEVLKLSLEEMEKSQIAEKKDYLEGKCVKVEKTYPAYFGSYEKFDKVIDYFNSIENLFLIGRNGMHKYNNMDHSMLTAVTAVRNIVNGIKDKSNIWAVNTEDDYHEKK
jgi:protoporphyrinogen oxidase